MNKLLPFAFLAVASSAGLEWMSGSAFGEVAKYQQSRQQLRELSELITRYTAAPAADRKVVAQELLGQVEQLAKQNPGEAYGSGSRRVVALTSWVVGSQNEDVAMAEGLRAEVRGLSVELEKCEAELLRRAGRSDELNRWVLAVAAGLAGMRLFELHANTQKVLA